MTDKDIGPLDIREETRYPLMLVIYNEIEEDKVKQELRSLTKPHHCLSVECARSHENTDRWQKAGK